MSLECLGHPISPEVFFGDISAKMLRFADGMVGPLDRGGGGLVFELASC